MENLFIIIPARLKSTRLPNKVLEKINGKSLVENVWQGLKKFPNVFIATDSEEIVKEVTKFNAKVILTNQNHNNGTERCAEVVEKLKLNDNDIVINVQCDELNINPDWIIDIYAELSNSKKEIITTVVTKISDQTSEFWNNYSHDPSNVQVLLDSNNIAKNFKRATKNILKNMKTSENLFTNHHLGIYGYRKKTLSKISKLNTTKREKEEKLEQLRWLEHGVKIKCINTKKMHFGYSINTKEDLERLKNQNIL